VARLVSNVAVAAPILNGRLTVGPVFAAVAQRYGRPWREPRRRPSGGRSWRGRSLVSRIHGRTTGGRCDACRSSSRRQATASRSAPRPDGGCSDRGRSPAGRRRTPHCPPSMRGDVAARPRSCQDGCRRSRRARRLPGLSRPGGGPAESECPDPRAPPTASASPRTSGRDGVRETATARHCR
jgi:hypothetical protein